MMAYPSIKQEVGNSSSPAGGMWGALPSQMMTQRNTNNIPFPVTPFNTPAQGPSVFMGNEMRNFFLSNTAAAATTNNHHQHLNSVSNPTLSVSIKEELTDLETDLETMKVGTNCQFNSIFKQIQMMMMMIVMAGHFHVSDGGR